MTVRTRLSIFYRRFLSLNGRPEEISRSMALGVFIGLTPTIPFHTALVFFVCLLFRQNITAAMLGATIVSNPLTIPFWYLIQYEIGRTLLGMTGNPFLVSDYGVLSILEAGWHILYPLLVGGLLTAAFFVIPSYFITLHTVRIVRKRNAEPAEPSA